MPSLWQYLEQPQGGAQKQANVAGPSPEPPPANNQPSHEGMEPGTIPPADFLADANATTPTLSEADLEKQAEAYGLLAADASKLAAEFVDERQQEAHDTYLVEDQLMKIANLDDATFEAEWGEYVKMGRDHALGEIGAYVKAAQDLTAFDGDQQKQAIKDQVAEIVAEDWGTRVPAEALRDPEALDEMAADITKAAAMIVDQMAEDVQAAPEYGKEAMVGDEAARRLGHQVRKRLGRVKRHEYGADLEGGAEGQAIDRLNRRVGRATAGGGAATVVGGGAAGTAAAMDRDKKAAIPGVAAVKNILTGAASNVAQAARTTHEGVVGAGHALRGGAGEVDPKSITGRNWARGTALDDADEIRKNRQIGAAIGYGGGGAATAATGAGAAAILGGNPLGTPNPTQ